MVPSRAGARASERSGWHDGESVDRPHHAPMRSSRSYRARAVGRANNRIARDRVVANQIIGPREREHFFFYFFFMAEYFI